MDYPAGSSPDFVVAKDLNGDGKLDLIVADRDSTSNNIQMLMGKGDGTFRPAVGYKAGKLPNPIAVGDFNGDHKLDLAVANSNEKKVSLLFGNGDGTFKSGGSVAVPNFPWHISTADFDGDGNLDLATANAGDGLGTTVSVLLGDGKGHFSPAKNFITGFDAHTVLVGDFDNNGSPDLAVVNALENTVTVLLNSY